MADLSASIRTDTLGSVSGRSLESNAAQRVIDIAIAAQVRGDLDQEAVGWVFKKAFETFRAEALVSVKAEREAKERRRG